MRPTDLRVTTVPAQRDRDSSTYICAWCGGERQRSGRGNRSNVCRDCRPLELAFGGAK